ncbi:phage portal protein [Ochrobactrum intermedium]|uniref:phage portal protein n=1 Tax=Brucella intermedia TaxID=94625 RepID=UPI00159C5483|nr:phage portal protein [Brucella intermedia]NVM41932.1 phage portal protein [Brucella intermedia]
MDILNIFRRKPQATAPQVHAQSEGQFIGFDDPRFKEWMRNGGDGVASPMSIKEAMRNTAVFRCVSLISYSIGMLPMHVIDTETKEKARESGLFSLLHSMPNDWQTAFNFRQYMQRNALVHGNAYALIVRSMDRVIRLVPLDPTTIRVKQNRDWSVEYEYTPKQGELRILKPKDVLHVYADSDDGICGTSMVKIAANAIDLARELETSQRRLFKNDMHLGGALLHPNKLSPEAYERLKTSMNEQYGGSENAGKWMIAEEGMKPEPFTGSAKDSQQIESRSMQIEEIGRAFGVPRPFLGVDDTSWGSGIDVLGQIFVRYALNPWFTAWEQAIKRSCMTVKEREQYEVKFNAGALLRGSMKDQADFFAKALGSGGHQPWMDYEEVRETMDLPEKDIAPNPLAQKGNGNEPQNPA